MRYALTVVLLLGMIQPMTGQDRHEDRYLCLAEQATGFMLHDGEWQITQFTAELRRFMVWPSSQDGVAYYVEVVGPDVPYYYCAEDFSEEELLSCDGYLGSAFTLNRKAETFIASSMGGYVVDSGAGRRDTPFMEIGRCSPF